jgi:hypothetical protein
MRRQNKGHTLNIYYQGYTSKAHKTLELFSKINKMESMYKSN